MDFDHYPAYRPPPGIASNFKNPVTLAKPLIVVNVLFITLMISVVAIRIYTKHYIVRKLWWDDCESYLLCYSIVKLFSY